MNAAAIKNRPKMAIFITGLADITPQLIQEPHSGIHSAPYGKAQGNMKLSFSKMHGLGNDFMVINAVSQAVSLTPQLISHWANRKTGIGFDQLLLVEPTTDAEFDFNYRIFNADGSEVGQCGNGARCLARFIADEKLSLKKQLRVRTLSSALTLTLQDDGQVSVDMGIPQFAPNQVPFVAEDQLLTYDLRLEQTTVSIGALSLGNPHAVLLVDSVDHAPVAEWGPQIESHARFPQRANVGFMQILTAQHIQLRVYERGAGETLACGSGACAAVVYGRLRQQLDKDVTVSLLGGDLHIHWDHPTDAVIMTGPAVIVYKGILEYDPRLQSST